MKFIVLLLFISLSNNLVAKPNQLEAVNKRLDALSERNNTLTTLNDSLNREIFRYKQKEDLYIALVERQATHFEWLIGIVFGLISIFVGYNAYNFNKKITRWQKINLRNTNKLRLDWKHQSDVYTMRSNEMQSKFNEFESSIYITVALMHNNNIMLKNPQIDNITDVDFSLYSSLESLSLLSHAYEMADEEQKENIVNILTPIIDNTKKTIESCKELIESDQDPEDLESIYERIEESYQPMITSMNNLIAANDERFSPDIVLIKYKINELLDYKDEEVSDTDEE